MRFGLAFEWSVFQPGRSVIDCSADGPTMMVVVRGKLKLRPALPSPGLRLKRIDATPFLPVSLEGHRYVVENKSYAVALLCRRSSR